MSQPFTERLRHRVAKIWDAQHRHPFVCGIWDGSLPLEKFKFWLRQDYLFLIDSARVSAVLAARCPDLEQMARFAELHQKTLKVEMAGHCAFAAEFGIPVEELQAERRSPITQGYGDFLLRNALIADFAHGVAAMLPCLWGYSEVGRRLDQNHHSRDERYSRWIKMYASPEFAELAEWGRQLLDGLTEGLPERHLVSLEQVFVVSSRYEWLFWDMAWKLADWPDDVLP